MTAKTFSLPHGASGVEVGDFVINFCSDKVVALAKYGDTHYTLHAGHASGVLDLHRTWRDPDGTERHQTVFCHATLGFARLTGGLVFRDHRNLPAAPSFEAGVAPSEQHRYRYGDSIRQATKR